jgi:type I restriction enzyme S subunit
VSTVRLRYIIRPREVTNRADLPVLSVYRDHGVVPKNSRSDNFNKTPDDVTRYQEVRVGDLAINKMKAWQGSLGISSYHGIVSPDYLVCSLDPSVDSRFFHYLMRSYSFAAQFGIRSKGIRPAQWRIYWEDLADIPVTLPSTDEQRRIAEFLDGEMARTERLCSLQSRVKASVGLRATAHLDLKFDELERAYGALPFRRMIRLIEQGVSPQCDNSPADRDEWGVLKVSAVKNGLFLAKENKRLPVDIEPETRYEIRQGDLLITRANTPLLVGSAATVDSSRRKLILCDKIFRVTITAELLPKFLVLASLSTKIRTMCAEASHGASQSMANLRAEEVKRWPIPAAPPVVQRKVVDELTEARDCTARLNETVDRQLAVLAERRQALVTAAVTGQLDVTTAHGIKT